MDYQHSDFYCATYCIAGSYRANGEYHHNWVYCQSATDCFCNDLRTWVWSDRGGSFSGYGKVFDTLYRDSTNRHTHIFRLVGATSSGYFQYVFHSPAYHRLNRRGVGSISVAEIEKGYH